MTDTTPAVRIVPEWQYGPDSPAYEKGTMVSWEGRYYRARDHIRAAAKTNSPRYSGFWEEVVSPTDPRPPTTAEAQTITARLNPNSLAAKTLADAAVAPGGEGEIIARIKRALRIGLNRMKKGSDSHLLADRKFVEETLTMTLAALSPSREGVEPEAGAVASWKSGADWTDPSNLDRLYREYDDRRTTDPVSIHTARLHPKTTELVNSFAIALAHKLLSAEEKYGYSDGWLTDAWEAKCKADLLTHVHKGDPLDVAAYAAFCWARDWSTTPPSEAHPTPADDRLAVALKHYACSCEPGHCAVSIDGDDVPCDDQLCGRKAAKALALLTSGEAEG